MLGRAKHRVGEWWSAKNGRGQPKLPRLLHQALVVPSLVWTADHARAVCSRCGTIDADGLAELARDAEHPDAASLLV